MKKQAKRKQEIRQRAAQKRQRRQNDVVGRAASLRKVPEPSPFPALPADKKKLLDRHDTLAALRDGLGRVARWRHEWAGIPMPLDGQRLVIEPSYPGAKELSEMGQKPEEPDTEAEGAKIRSQFWSWKKRGDVVIYEKDGEIRWGVWHMFTHTGKLLQTLGVSDAWGIEQEGRALQLLGTMLRHRAFKQYLLTGSFIETSKRSGIAYMFRKLRPTLAISMRGDEARVLCSLCLHPVAYYAGSWGGAMCPTDDVIAHLALMRGDEHMFWRRANQHAPYRSEAGI